MHQKDDLFPFHILHGEAAKLILQARIGLLLSQLSLYQGRARRSGPQVFSLGLFSVFGGVFSFMEPSGRGF